MVLTVSVSLEKELFFTLDWHDDKTMPHPIEVIIKYNDCFIMICILVVLALAAMTNYIHLAMLVKMHHIILIKSAKHHRRKNTTVML